MLFLATRETRHPEAVAVGHEHAHAHVELLEQTTDCLLLPSRALAHAVVLEGTETLVVHETDLVKKLFAGRVAEHPEVGGVVELETVLLSCRFEVHSCGIPSECSRTGSLFETNAGCNTDAGDGCGLYEVSASHGLTPGFSNVSIERCDAGHRHVWHWHWPKVKRVRNEAHFGV